jgi:methylglutaconyl-CoA hydratase
MSSELVHLDVTRGVATITLDSPANRNALSRQLLSDLERHLASALGDDRARVIVLTGNGPSFCSGADLKERRAENAEPGDGSSAAPNAPRPRGLAPILATLWNAPKPIVGRITGPARAGGIGLVAACDIAVAVETATFAFSEVRIGVIPAMIAVVVVPKIGESRALELFMTGDTFDAKRAASYGLLAATAPEAELDAAVDRYVNSLLRGGPAALAGSKRLARDLRHLSMDAAFVEMAERSARFFRSEEAREGLAAFAEKRAPRWVTGPV